MTKAWKRENFSSNSVAIAEFCAHYGFKLEHLNHGYQLRINGVMDVYPVRQRWHWLNTGERGEFDNMTHLKNIMLKRLQEAANAVANNKVESVEVITKFGHGLNTVHSVDGGETWRNKSKFGDKRPWWKKLLAAMWWSKK